MNIRRIRPSQTNIPLGDWPSPAIFSLSMMWPLGLAFWWLNLMDPAIWCMGWRWPAMSFVQSTGQLTGSSPWTAPSPPSTTARRAMSWCKAIRSMPSVSQSTIPAFWSIPKLQIPKPGRLILRHRYRSMAARGQSRRLFRLEPFNQALRISMNCRIPRPNKGAAAARWNWTGRGPVAGASTSPRAWTTPPKSDAFRKSGGIRAWSLLPLFCAGSCLFAPSGAAPLTCASPFWPARGVMGVFNCFFDRILPGQGIIWDRQLNCLEAFDLVAQPGGFFKF